VTTGRRGGASPAVPAGSTRNIVASFSSFFNLFSKNFLFLFAFFGFGLAIRAKKMYNQTTVDFYVGFIQPFDFFTERSVV